MSDEFIEQFHGLKGKRLSIDGKIVEYKMKDGRKINVFREIEIEKYCFDKEKVEKVAEELRINITNLKLDRHSEADVQTEIIKFKKELGI